MEPRFSRTFPPSVPRRTGASWERHSGGTISKCTVYTSISLESLVLFCSRCGGEYPAVSSERWCAAMSLIAAVCTSFAERFMHVQEIPDPPHHASKGGSHLGQQEIEEKQPSRESTTHTIVHHQVLSPPRLSTGAGPRQHGYGAAACSSQGLPSHWALPGSSPISVIPTLTELASFHLLRFVLSLRVSRGMLCHDHSFISFSAHAQSVHCGDKRLICLSPIC